jgi:signal peptidase II
VSEVPESVRRRRIVVSAWIIVASLVVDLVTKWLAATYLQGRGRFSYLGDTFRLAYAENTGAFLGLGAALPSWAKIGIVVAVAAFMVLIAVYIVRAVDLGVGEAAAMALFLSGGVGNLIDRLWLGFVRDFMNVGIGSLRTGIFNVADMALMAGAAMLLIVNLKGRSEKP